MRPTLRSDDEIHLTAGTFNLSVPELILRGRVISQSSLAFLNVFFQNEIDVLAEIAVVGLRERADPVDHILVQGDTDFIF